MCVKLVFMLVLKGAPLSYFRSFWFYLFDFTHNTKIKQKGWKDQKHKYLWLNQNNCKALLQHPCLLALHMLNNRHPNTHSHTHKKERQRRHTSNCQTCCDQNVELQNCQVFNRHMYRIKNMNQSYKGLPGQEKFILRIFKWKSYLL